MARAVIKRGDRRMSIGRIEDPMLKRTTQTYLFRITMIRAVNRAVDAVDFGQALCRRLGHRRQAAFRGSPEKRSACGRPPDREPGILLVIAGGSRSGVHAHLIAKIPRSASPGHHAGSPRNKPETRNCSRHRPSYRCPDRYEENRLLQPCLRAQTEQNQSHGYRSYGATHHQQRRPATSPECHAAHWRAWNDQK